MGRPHKIPLTNEELLTLLRESEEDQIEIAARLGVTPSAITTRVRSYLGIAPMAYRAQHGWAGRGFPPSRVLAIREAYRAGAGQTEVARAYGTTDEKVAEIMGDELRSREEQRALTSLIPSERMDEAIRRYRAGESCVDLAVVFDCSERSIRRILDAAGVKRRTRGTEAYWAMPEATRRRMATCGTTKKSTLPIGVTTNVKVKDRWYAKLTFRGQVFSLGGHDTPEDAGRAYDAKARELWGSDARLNFPDEGQ